MKEKLLHAYSKVGSILSYATSNLKMEDLLAKPGPGLWSVTEVILHIVDCDLVFTDRIKRVLAEENPSLLAFDENKWKENLAYEPKNVPSAVRLFTANREHVSQILESITNEDLKRTGIHSEAGAITLQTIIEKANGHFDHHIKFLYGKRASLKKEVAEIYSY